jgi:hypothetical protein
MAKVFKLALVARGATSLAKYPTDDADLYEKALKILRKVDPAAPFSVVEQHNLVFTASTTPGGMSFVCLCDKSVETRRVGQFLSNLKSKWMQSYGPASSEFQKDAKDEEFQPQLRELIDHYNEISPPLLPAEAPEPEPHPFVVEVEPREPEVVEGFGGQESLTGLRARIWWQRHKWHLLVFLGLVLWVYISCAWYCGGLTLGGCF